MRTALPSRLYAYGFNVRTAYEAIALNVDELSSSAALKICLFDRLSVSALLSVSGVSERLRGA